MRKFLTSSSQEIEPYAIFGGGAGDGLAAVCGYQSGDEGMRVVIPAFSPGDRNNLGSIHPLPGATSAFCLVHVSCLMSHVKPNPGKQHGKNF